MMHITYNIRGQLCSCGGVGVAFPHSGSFCSWLITIFKCYRMDRVVSVFIQLSHAGISHNDFSGSRSMRLSLLGDEMPIYQGLDVFQSPSYFPRCVHQPSLCFLVPLAYHGLLLQLLHQPLVVLCTRSVEIYPPNGLAPRKSMLILSYPCASGAYDRCSTVTLPTFVHALVA